MPKAIVAVWHFKSKSNPSAKPHEARLYFDGSTSCNCPGWTQHVRDKETGARSCRHVEAIENGTARRISSAVQVFGTVKMTVAAWTRFGVYYAELLEDNAPQMGSQPKPKPAKPRSATRDDITADAREIVEGLKRAERARLAQEAAADLQRAVAEGAARDQPTAPEPRGVASHRRKIDLTLLEDE